MRPFPNGDAKATVSPGPVASGVSGMQLKGTGPGGSGVSFIGTSGAGSIAHLLGGYPADGGEYFDFKNVSGVMAYAVASLAYICIRYRCKKLIEAPLMVVEETKTGVAWVEGHDLDALLMRPNPDYGMRRLLEATEIFLQTTGRCVWVKNRDRGNRTGSLYPFSGDDVTVERGKDRKGQERLFGKFRIAGIKEPFDAADVVHFYYVHPGDPLAAHAPLDAALSALNIGQALQSRAKAVVKNRFSAGAVYVVDKDARLDDEAFNRLKGEINAGFAGANSGKTMIAEGGGSIVPGPTLGDMQMGELWREVEAQVCGCFGVPASIAGTIIGLENSPWSHMDTALRQFYDDTIIPEWTDIAEALTDQLLRDVDTNPKRSVRFDDSEIRALQEDRQANALIASASSRITSVNERRILIGLEPSKDPKADDIPELTEPSMTEMLALRNVPKPDDEDDEPDPEKDAEKQKSAALEQKAKRRTLQHAMFEHTAKNLEDIYLFAVQIQLERDRSGVVDVAERALGLRSKAEGDELTEGRIRGAIEAAAQYLAKQSRAEWESMIRPLLQNGARRAAEMLIADLDVDMQLLNPDLLAYADREAAWLIKGVADTTKDAVRAAIRAGFEAGEGSREIAARLTNLPGFNRDRALLVARTESVRVATGAPTEALANYSKRTGNQFQKVWYAVIDERTRDEHAEMDGETVPVEKPFSNGLMHPSEPNCRCAVLFEAAA